MARRFEYAQAEEIRDAFSRHGVRYLFDLVFAPDGIEEDDIIRSKEAVGRVKDREALPRLRAFRDYWLEGNRRA